MLINFQIQGSNFQNQRINFPEGDRVEISLDHVNYNDFLEKFFPFFARVRLKPQAILTQIPVPSHYTNGIKGQKNG